MSSMRNAIQRHNHKERAQPREREKWGILEKHKDYSLRSRDFNEKKKKVRILRQKATERNPDEFHFAMMSRKTRDGGRLVADRGNRSLSQDAVRLLKTQDAGYLQDMAQRTRRARERLEQQLVCEDAIRPGTFMGTPRTSNNNRNHSRHLVFVDSSVPHETYDDNTHVDPSEPGFVSTQHVKKTPSHKTGVFANAKTAEACNLSKERSNEAKTKESLRVDFRALQKRTRRRRDLKQSILASLKRRENDIMVADRELVIQRGRMSNSVGSATKTGLKFKAKERKH